MQQSRNRSLREKILDHSFWYHRIDLGDRFYTPGYVGAEKYLELGLPEDLSGKSVLDIGSYNGLIPFETERRGADRVLATDLWELDDREDALERDHRRRGFELAREYLDSDVEAESIDLLDVSPETVGTFDIVVCAGVLYRLKHPTVGIENLVSVANERIVLTTMRPRWIPAEIPAMEFYEGAERLSDPTIWWMPTPAGIDGLLRSSGCRRVETSLVPGVSDESVPPTAGGEIKHAPLEVFADHALENPLGKVVPDRVGRGDPDERQRPPYRVTVLYHTGDAARIMFADETDQGTVEYRQAWIDADDVSPASSQSTPRRLIEGLTEIYREEGLHGALQRTVERLRYGRSPEEYVTHAFV